MSRKYSGKCRFVFFFGWISLAQKKSIINYIEAPAAPCCWCCPCCRCPCPCCCWCCCSNRRRWCPPTVLTVSEKVGAAAGAAASATPLTVSRRWCISCFFGLWSPLVLPRIYVAFTPKLHRHSDVASSRNWSPHKSSLLSNRKKVITIYLCQTWCIRVNSRLCVLGKPHILG